MLLVKIAKYVRFCVYRRSYLLWSPVIVFLTVGSSPLLPSGLRYSYLEYRTQAIISSSYKWIVLLLEDICICNTDMQASISGSPGDGDVPTWFVHTSGFTGCSYD